MLNVNFSKVKSPHLSESASTTPSASRALLLVGGLFVIFGILVLLFGSWSELGPVGHVLATTVPLLALYWLSFLAWKKPLYRTLSSTILIVASVILPLVIGVIITETHSYNSTDPWLGLVVSLISLVIYAIIEFWLQQEQQAFFTGVALVASTLNLASVMHWAPYWHPVAALLAGLVLLKVARFLKQSQSDGEASVYHTIGFAITMFSAAALPFSYYVNIFNTPSQPELYISLGYPVIALFFLGVAIYFSYLWRQYSKDILAYQLRVFAENAAAVVLVVPAILIAMSHTHRLDDLIVFVLGVLALSISYAIRVRLFRIMGYVGVLFAFIRVILVRLTLLKLTWPILLLAIGFILIMLAFLVIYLQAKQSLSILWKETDDSLFHLGEEGTFSKTQHSWSVWQWFGFGFLLLFLLAIIR